MMCIFKNLLCRKTAIEKELEEKYLPLFVSIFLSISEAKKTFNNVIKVIKKESQEQDTCKWPENFGDILLERESTDLWITKKEISMLLLVTGTVAIDSVKTTMGGTTKRSLGVSSSGNL